MSEITFQPATPTNADTDIPSSLESELSTLRTENARMAAALHWIAREATHKHIRERAKFALGVKSEDGTI